MNIIFRSGNTIAEKMVLRKKPSGSLLPSAHQVEREYAIMSFLHSKGFPVPTPYALIEDEKVIGTPFFLMEYIEGTIFKFAPFHLLTLISGNQNSKASPQKSAKPPSQNFTE